MARIFIACDHRGVETCNRIIGWCEENSHNATFMGPDKADGNVDYPDYAFPLVEKVVGSRGRSIGILVCGWGNGMVIAANKVKGARAALCMDRVQAEYARSHNNANVLVLSAEATGWGMMKEILDAFIKGKFGGGRHARRLGKIAGYRKNRDYRRKPYRSG